MGRLSSPLESMRDHYDVVVVGSGYGGGIAASRLARAGRSVCLLERGPERQPGEYPDTLPEASANMNLDLPGRHVGSRTGMFNFHVNEDISVLVGCGLGGTSLINANVSLRAEPRVFEDERWPEELRGDLTGRVADAYRHAEQMLKPNPYPSDWPEPRKTAAHRRSGEALGAEWYRPPINVTFEDPEGGVNHVGVEQRKCTLCGDCVTGCNDRAKNTTLMNYIPDAHNHGAEIFCEASVRHLERRDDRWVVWYEALGADRAKFDAPALSVTADVVVLGAGTLGTTEILLRSRANGLALSDQLGRRFSGNGDVLGFAYDTDGEIDGVGFGHRPREGRTPVGPCISSIVDMREQPELKDGLVLEEGSIPGALGPILGPSFGALAQAEGGGSIVDKIKAGARSLGSTFGGPYRGPVNRTQTYLIMSQDDGDGEMVLEDDRLRIRWPGVGRERTIVRDNERMKAAAEAIGGTFLPNPIWNELLGDALISVHPLGGCCMGPDAANGVTNHKGQVFRGSDGTDVYEGLYVNDGAIIPRPVGVNPLLTISAVAERNCAILAEERGWTIDYALPSKPRETAPPKPGVQFTEKMKGWFSTHATDDFEGGEKAGKRDGSTLEFVLTVVSEDVEAMMAHPEHEARMYGTVSAPELSPEPMRVHDGVFQLFVRDETEVNTRKMRYRMRMHAADGTVYFFDAYKIVKHGSLLRVWHDTSTLYVTVHGGEDSSAPVCGKGILHIRPADFAKQMTTMQVPNATSTKQRLDALARFGKFFAGAVWESYGPVGSCLVDLGDAPPRKKRPLDAPAPVIHAFATEDGVELQLKRYEGGTKGPVICAPGFGNNVLPFDFDGIETNTVEFLCANGYDVWLFDYRASPSLAASKTQFTIDDIARYDWPAAVAKVREITGAADVQAMNHCMGSMTCFMALLSGLEGVRSFVSSQLTPYCDVELADKLKAGIHLEKWLELAGVKGLTTDPGGDALGKLVDALLAVYPMPNDWAGLNKVCHRIYALYGHVFKPENLNQATHDAQGEMFGYGNITAFDQIMTILRAGHIVDAKGNDVYLPNVERLKIPIAFIHGADNVFFEPSGSEKSYEWLREHNGTELYTRTVIPNYAHLDCFIGKHAARDVFPTIVAALDEHN